jgi:hypothetical protein
LGEVGNFNTAVIEMKRYLLLVPDAPNTRAAQDKIYIWEGKANAAQDKINVKERSESTQEFKK